MQNKLPQTVIIDEETQKCKQFFIINFLFTFTIMKEIRQYSLRRLHLSSNDIEYIIKETFSIITIYQAVTNGLPLPMESFRNWPWDF